MLEQPLPSELARDSTSPRVRRPTHRGGRNAICHTCTTCRSRKVKCDGQQPLCGSCRARGHVCKYPQDGRRTAVRSKAADVRSLQRQITELQEKLSQQRPAEYAAPPSPAAKHLERVSQALMSPLSVGIRGPDEALPGGDTAPRLFTQETHGLDSAETSAPTASSLPVEVAMAPDDGRLSSPETNADSGGELQVYGATSLLHDRASGDFWTTPRSLESESDAARDRLIAQAAISAQKENLLYFTPSIINNIDFDGLAPDMAMHLLDLHWHRLHLVYLITYRPAIMDSLLNNGPYVNKLLLNSIYLQSSLYSERSSSLRLNPDDPQTTGMAFYKRFKALLPRYIDQPTMPTVVALLLCGACLLPYGKQSAGWVYCGMAYRMMLDLGYHLDIPPSSSPATKFSLSTTDAEIRRRVYWGAYACDKFQSLYLGRPPAVYASDSNIPQEYLDSYEEMAEWKPYVDSLTTAVNPRILAYRGRPCYAVSTFQCLLRLSMITEQVLQKLYSVKSAGTPQMTLLQTRRDVRSQLDHWNRSLPAYLKFDPAKDPTLPPHQVSLHTTHWALVILTEQAFLRRGHFEFTLDPESEDEARRDCVDAAFRIWRLLEAYKKAFTLRHAHYGLFYAAYSAVLVMLQQANEDHGDYIECIRFFWVILSDYQRGYARGLKKPFRVLKSLMHQINKVTQQISVDDLHTPANTAGSDGPIANTDPLLEPTTLGFGDAGDMDAWPDFWTDMLAEDASFMDNTMFGLFTEL